MNSINLLKELNILRELEQKLNNLSPRDHRRKRRKIENNILIPENIESYELPESINNIKDMIAFAHTYKGNNIKIDKLKKIIPILLELEEMVGLESTKKSILDMIMHFVQKRHTKNEDYLHMVVCGPPGCGKTTFCRIVGKILSGLNVLPKDSFTTVKRTDMIAKYLGQTAHTTEKILKKCKGGVMFIDEAYSLAPRNSDRDSFAKEAIDFLNQFLSEHKDDLCCIIAGYEDELEQTIFNMNEGLKRRFPWKFVIEKYTDEELLEIFKRMVIKSKFTLDKDAINQKFFKDNKDYFKFAGGDIETFITKCKIMHTRNTFGKDVNNIIDKKDITDALKEHKKIKKVHKINSPPNNMYL